MTVKTDPQVEEIQDDNVVVVLLIGRDGKPFDKIYRATNPFVSEE